MRQRRAAALELAQIGVAGLKVSVSSMEKFRIFITFQCIMNQINIQLRNIGL
jgi:hypothetical protein